MKESHVEGVANHHGPESCVGGGNVAGEALTGENAGRSLSSEITSSGRRPRWLRGKATQRATLTRVAGWSRGVVEPAHV